MLKKDTPYGIPTSGPPPKSFQNESPLVITTDIESTEPSMTSKTSYSKSRVLKFFERTDATRKPEVRVSSFSSQPVSSFEDDDWPPILTNEDFEKALLRYGSRKRFLCCLFLLCATPGILNGFHIVIHLFSTRIPKHWCSIPILEKAEWTSEEIRNISSPNSEEWSNCEYYDIDYEKLRRLGYARALEAIATDKKPRTLDCKRYSYEEEQPGTSIVPEWNLVCDRLTLKATVQIVTSIGKVSGAFIFGFISDRTGRKVSFNLACLIYIIAGPVVACTRIYYVMLIGKAGLGIASLGVYESAYSILIETCPSELRATLGVLYNQSHPLGIIIITFVGCYVKDWRTLQLYASLPTVLLVLNMWFLPESPRWLYYSGRKKRAWIAVAQFLPLSKNDIFVVHNGIPSISANYIRHFGTVIKNYIELMKNTEFRRRLLICWNTWCFVSISYYTLTLKADYLQKNPYLYAISSGIAEGTSYALVVPLIQTVGRQAASTILLLSASGTLLILLTLPANMVLLRLIVSVLGRLFACAVLSVIIVHACELFPTTLRNTAIGTSFGWAHIGGTVTPYIMDFFVIYGWWIPNTICSLILFVAALLSQTLPETKELIFYDTLQDLTSRCQMNPTERVSFADCILLRMYTKCKKFRNFVKRRYPT